MHPLCPEDKKRGSKVVNHTQRKIAETTFFFFFTGADKTYHITERRKGKRPSVLPWQHSGLSPTALAREELA